MNNAQRWLATGAFGAGCATAANILNKWLTFRHSDGGWFNYAPNNGISFSPAGSLAREALVWIIAIAVWFVVSYRILAASDDR